MKSPNNSFRRKVFIKYLWRYEILNFLFFYIFSFYHTFKTSEIGEFCFFSSKNRPEQCKKNCYRDFDIIRSQDIEQWTFYALKIFCWPKIPSNYIGEIRDIRVYKYKKLIYIYIYIYLYIYFFILFIYMYMFFFYIL